MAELRAYRVTKDGDPVGDLGEGRGPFVTSSSSGIGYVMLTHARFTCVDALHEDAVGDVLETSKTFDAVVAALQAAGFVLVPARYDAIFQPVEQTPLAGPELGGGGDEGSDE
ncbi:hypothetical protein L6R52_27485 [Myxococcota bacterium]|nr:hypothetical protein [Myxococcota bacterium]